MNKSIAEITIAITGGGTPARQIVEFWKGNIPWATVKDVKEGMKYLQGTEEHITETGLRSSASNLVTANSLIVCTRMAVGRSVLTTRPTAINQDLKCLKIKPEYDVNFVYYQITNEQNTIEGQAIGSTVKGISVGELKKLSFHCPDSLPVQRKIARILSTIDGQIEKTEAIIAKYQAIKQGMLQDLFTRGIDVRTGQLRPRYEDAPELYKESALGRIPKEWEVVRLGQLAEKVGSGITPTGGSEVYQKEGILFIRSQNVLNNQLLLDDVAFISEKIDEQMASSRLKPYDVLLNITGASIGRCTYFPEHLIVANVNQHVCIIRFNNVSEDIALMASVFMNSNFGQSQIFKLNAGGNREGLNFQQIRSFYFPYFSDTEIKRIASVIRSKMALIDNEQLTLSKLQLLKQGLMQDLLSGKVEVDA